MGHLLRAHGRIASHGLPGHLSLWVGGSLGPHLLGPPLLRISRVLHLRGVGVLLLGGTLLEHVRLSGVHLPHGWLAKSLLRLRRLGEGALVGHGDGDDGARVEVVLDDERAAVVLHVLLGVGQAAADPADVLLHLLGCRGGAVLEGARLLLDAGALVGEADGVSVVEDGDGRLDEVGVHEVLDDLADHGEGDLAALLLREFGDGGGYLLEVGAHVLGLYHHDARGRRRVVEDGDAGRVGDDLKVACHLAVVLNGVADRRRLVCRTGAHEWIEGVCHLLRSYEQEAPDLGLPCSFNNLSPIGEKLQKVSCGL